MSNWIFTEDFELKSKLDQAINLDFVTTISLRIEGAELVFFVGAEGHADPHILAFHNKEQCLTAYQNLKLMLKAES